MDKQITDYIRINLTLGKSKEEIYKELLNQGTTLENIQTGFNSLTSSQDKEDTQKKTVHIILITAAILVSAGIFSFIASNWQEITQTIKVAIIIITMYTAYSLGWYFNQKLKLLKTGEALILLGSIIYGAGIFLVAQMFNIRANWPDGFILWMIGVIALAFALKSYTLFNLAIPLGIIALVGHPFGILGGIGYNSFLLTSSFLLLISTIITFVTGMIIRNKMPPQLKEFY